MLNILHGLQTNIPATGRERGRRRQSCSDRGTSALNWQSADCYEPYLVHAQQQRQSHNHQHQRGSAACPQGQADSDQCAMMGLEKRRKRSRWSGNRSMNIAATIKTTTTATRLLAMWPEIVNYSVIPVLLVLLLASQFTVILAINAVAEGEPKTNTMDNSLDSRSMFTTKNNTSIVAQRGGVAVLPCSVRINSQATVSWIRRQDYKLLTVGQENLSSDERFVSEFGRHLGHASLRIKSVRSTDNGFYECQLSSYPPQSIFVELKISEVMTEIGDGGTDIHIDIGSQLRLECKLKYATEVPTFAFWYFGDRMINYDLDEGYLVEDVSKYYNSTNSSYNMHLVISVLVVESVNKKHAGNYSCSPSNAKSAQVTVHVLHDEKPAAMQHANRGNNFKLNFTLASIIFLLVIRLLGVALCESNNVGGGRAAAAAATQIEADK